jgi:hypothetical protein
MSATEWMRRLRDRPIADHERRGAMSAAIVLLSVVAVALVLTGPASRANDTQHAADHTAGPRALQSIGEQQADRDYEERRVCRRFLAGYLSYLYGHGEASQITDASSSLIASLREHPPRVPPALRASHPRVLSVQPVPAPTGQAQVTAVINDGGLIDYTIELRVALERGRMLVSEVESALWT